MPHHACIDPQDQYGEAEVLVEFETLAGVVRLISVRDASNEDILPDLDDVQRQALRSEILDDFRHGLRSTGGLPRRGPTNESQKVGSA
jgi:hypothetical protein